MLGNQESKSLSAFQRSLIVLGLGLGLFFLAAGSINPVGSQEKSPPADPKQDFATFVQPLISKHCLSCHAAKTKKGDLDLERFRSMDLVRKDLKPWQLMIEQLEAGEMPPKDKPQPSAVERKRLIDWTRQMLEFEARARAGDPGEVKLRRLSNAEYNCTIRDLTGIDFQPAREFPADGAAGEGFTNAADALTMSPALVDKFLNSAKDLADHAVLLPDGFRFSPGKTRRDWTDESLAELRKFYGEFAGADGRLPLKPYLSAIIHHRQELVSGKATLDALAAKEKLSPKYLQILWRTLTDKAPSFPLDAIRSRWQQSSEKDVDALVAEIAKWQKALWKFVPIGSYRDRNMIRQVANDAGAFESQSLKRKYKPVPGEAELPLKSGMGYKQLREGFAEFRSCFPQFICFPSIVPVDEAVSLKLFHREDEPLIRLFLDDAQTRRLERLWAEHRFITRWPITEHKNLPLFIGFVTQDQPKELVVYFERLARTVPPARRAIRGGSRSGHPQSIGSPARFRRSRLSPTTVGKRAGRATQPVPGTAQEGCFSRRRFSRRLDADSGVAFVSLPNRTIAAGKRAASRERLGVGVPAQLFPLVDDARRGTAPVAAAGTSARSESVARTDAAHVKK